MNEHQMRSYLKGQYPYSNNWARKVDAMSNEQVVAIYLRIQEEEPKKELTTVSPDQLTLF